MRLKSIAIATIILAAHSPWLAANDLKNNDAYAKLQDCMASAEIQANLGSQLDQYCINSYLATIAPGSS